MPPRSHQKTSSGPRRIASRYERSVVLPDGETGLASRPFRTVGVSMRQSQIERLRADIQQLEAELGSLGNRPNLDPEAERRLEEIQHALPEAPGRSAAALARIARALPGSLNRRACGAGHSTLPHRDRKR